MYGIPSSTSTDLSSSYAVRSFEKKKQLSPEPGTRDPRSYYHYLMALNAEKGYQMEQAASHYKEVVQHDPETERFQEKLIRLLLRTGQLDEAVRAGQNALSHFPENEEILMILGDILAGQGKIEQAIIHYDLIIKSAPDNARALLLKGALLEGLEKFDQALEEYKKGALVESKNPLVQFYLGRAYLRADQLKLHQRIFRLYQRPFFIFFQSLIKFLQPFQQGSFQQQGPGIIRRTLDNKIIMNDSLFYLSLTGQNISEDHQNFFIFGKMRQRILTGSNGLIQLTRAEQKTNQFFLEPFCFWIMLDYFLIMRSSLFHLITFFCIQGHQVMIIRTGVSCARFGRKLFFLFERPHCIRGGQVSACRTRDTIHCRAIRQEQEHEQYSPYA
jgi:tetratricopeptide (TPR) repeat protein